ncbi:HEAT repeat domain-containing protein [Bacteroidota bacterium]
MKTIINILFFSLFINIYSVKCQERGMIKKQIMTYDELVGNEQPAILEAHHNYNVTVLNIDNLVIKPIKLLSAVDIYQYYLIPGSHNVIACMRLGQQSGNYTYYATTPLSVTFKAEAGKKYILRYRIFTDLQRWNLLVIDKETNDIVASWINTRLKEILKVIDNEDVPSRIDAIYELKTLIKMEENNATHVLKDIGEKKAIKVLLMLLYDDNVKVRINTISVLTEINNDTIATAIKKQYINSNGEEKIILNSALIIFNEDNYDYSLVEKGLNSNNYLVRAATAYAAGKLGNNEMVKPLINLLNDEYSQVRIKSAWSLGELGDKSVIPNLKLLKKDKDTVVQEKAKEAIKKLKKLE